MIYYLKELAEHKSQSKIHHIIRCIATPKELMLCFYYSTNMSLSMGCETESSCPLLSAVTDFSASFQEACPPSPPPMPGRVITLLTHCHFIVLIYSQGVCGLDLDGESSLWYWYKYPSYISEVCDGSLWWLSLLSSRHANWQIKSKNRTFDPASCLVKKCHFTPRLIGSKWTN